MASIILKNLKPENIRAGVKILKTVGTFEAGPGILNEDITVDSSTVEQQFQAGEGYTGLGTVTVNPYVLDSKTVNSSTSSQTVTSDEGGLSSVTVNPYTLDTKTVNSSTSSQTVTSDEDGLSSVTVNPYTLEAKTVDASVSAQTITPSTADGLSSVTLNAVTSSIDSNISAGNIKNGVTILGVTGTLSSDSDWILDAKGGATTLDTDTGGLSDTNYGMYQLLQNLALTSVTFRNTTATGDYAFYQMLTGCNSLQNVSFPNLTTISGTQTFYKMCSQLGNVTFSFPELKTIDGNESFAQVRYGVNGFYPSFPKLESVKGTKTFSNFFENGSGSSSPVPYELPELKELDGSECMANFCLSGRGGCSSFSMPKLESIKGSYNLQGMFASNSRCRTLSMPRLLYCEGTGQQFHWLWQSVSSSPGNTITTTPEFFKYTSSSMYSIQSYLGTINLVIPQDYTYLDGWNNTGTTYLNFNDTVVNNSDLTDANILDILQKLGSVSDYDQVNYTVNFTTRTINDNMYFDYTTAYNKLIDAGWTINNLTIDAPKFIDVTSGSTLNLKNDDTITFDAMYSWTAAVNDPSIGLSAYSGNAGSSQSVTVTMDPNWEGNATVTFSCSDGTVTQTASVNVIYSNSNYVRLSYVDVGGNGSGAGDTGVTLTAASKMQMDFMSLNYSGGVIVSTDSRDGFSNEWRTFGYTGNMYFDLGGGGNNTRMSVGGWCQNNVRNNYEFGKYYITNLNTSQTVTGSGSNPFTSTSPDTMKIGGELDSTRIYELKFYVNGTDLSHDFVPAKDANDVVGMWDMINDTFVTPATGTWTGGSPV